MLIDWFTVVAQMVNFLVLVWLLKHFLYGRVVAAMDERDKRIAQRLEEAARQRTQAQETQERYQRQAQELEDSKRGLLDQARQEAQERRRELMDQARQDVERMAQGWRQALRREQDGFRRELGQMAGREVLKVVGTVLADLSGQKAQESALELFRAQLEALDDQERQQLAQALTQADQALLVAAWELDEAQKQTLGQAVRQTLDSAVELEFQHDPELILGLELRGRGRKLGWHAADRLEELADALENRLRREAQAGPEAAEAPTANPEPEHA